MSPHIVVVGSINMDLVVRVPRLPLPGETLLAHDFQAIPGGKGANQAVAAARLGARVTMIGRVGDDGYGLRLKSGLENEGIDAHHVGAVGCSSGIAVIAIADEGANSIMVVAGANQQLTPADIHRLAAVIASADLLLVQLEVPLESVQAAIEIAHANGVVTILDPAPAPATPLPADLMQVDVLTPNESEAAALTGIAPADHAQAVQAAEALRLGGARNVVLKLGASGALLLPANGAIEMAPAFEVAAVDSTGAGDAFTAALGVGLGEGLPLAQAVCFACAAGALATTRLGAQPAMPARREVEDLRKATAKQVGIP